MNDKLDEIIEFLSNVDCGGEFDCAIENHRGILKEHNVEDADMLEICEVCDDMITTRTYFDDFIHDYYKSVIKTVCDAIETYKK